MDTIDFLLCSNFNPDDDGWSSEEEAPVDLPAPEPPTSGPARAPVKAMGRRRDSRSKSPGAASARAHEDRTRAESVESDDAGPWEAAAPDAAAAAPMTTMAGDDEDSAEREAPDDDDEALEARDPAHSEAPASAREAHQMWLRETREAALEAEAAHAEVLRSLAASRGDEPRRRSSEDALAARRAGELEEREEAHAASLAAAADDQEATRTLGAQALTCSAMPGTAFGGSWTATTRPSGSWRFAIVPGTAPGGTTIVCMAGATVAEST